MKTMMHQSLRVTLGALLLLGGWSAIASSAGWTTVPPRVQTGAMLLLAIGALVALLFRRVRNEDQVAHLEAELCRERNARSQADEALAEADLLLARLSARSIAATAHDDPLAPLSAIQAELAQIQHSGAVDAAMAARLELLSCRLELVAKLIRSPAGAAATG
jgi:hypothetical protein